MDEIAEIICKDSGNELVLLESLVAITIAHNLTAYEQNLFGNFLQALGQNLCIMSIKKARCKTCVSDFFEESSINTDITNESTR